MDLFKQFNYLGFHNPYYILQDGKLNVFSSFENALSHIPCHQRILDFSAVVEVFSTGFCFADRTLIKGIQKTPWMARPNSQNTLWEYFDVPNHKENKEDISTIAKKFYNLLERELIKYVADHKNIGILLTGGMDSRVVAAVLRNLLNSGKISGKSVYAFTWGKETSRDVVYASRIAHMFDWSWKHLVVDMNQMEENCEIALQKGCEFTPIHLHAMPQVSREAYLDCVIAASFGDSVGRAEFSGKKVQQLTTLEKGIKNIGGILRSDYQKIVVGDVQKDLLSYREIFPQIYSYQQYELDQQLHYMRRMLNACMSVINDSIPLYQMFTDPSVFGYMWSLSPELRNDGIYYHLLKSCAPELLDIPWARTGLKYFVNEGQPDKLTKKHHDYGEMIRQNMLDKIEDTINKNIDIARELFDTKAVSVLIENLRKFPIKGSILFEDRLLYLCQLIKFVKLHNLKIELPDNKRLPFTYLKGDLYYKLRYLYRFVK